VVAIGTRRTETSALQVRARAHLQRGRLCATCADRDHPPIASLIDMTSQRAIVSAL